MCVNERDTERRAGQEAEKNRVGDGKIETHLIAPVCVALIPCLSPTYNHASEQPSSTPMVDITQTAGIVLNVGSGLEAVGETSVVDTEALELGKGMREGAREASAEDVGHRDLRTVQQRWG